MSQGPMSRGGGGEIGAGARSSSLASEHLVTAHELLRAAKVLSQHHCTVSATILAHNRIEGLDSFDTQADLDRLSYKGNVLPLGVKKTALAVETVPRFDSNVSCWHGPGCADGFRAWFDSQAAPLALHSTWRREPPVRRIPPVDAVLAPRAL